LYDGDNNNGQNKPTSDDVEGKGVPSPGSIVPNPIESSVAGDTRPLAIGQIVIASSGSRQKKKNVLLESKHK
jgi:hypothetical protein